MRRPRQGAEPSTRLCRSLPGCSCASPGHEFLPVAHRRTVVHLDRPKGYRSHCALGGIRTHNLLIRRRCLQGRREPHALQAQRDPWCPPPHDHAPVARVGPRVVDVVVDSPDSSQPGRSVAWTRKVQSGGFARRSGTARRRSTPLRSTPRRQPRHTFEGCRAASARCHHARSSRLGSDSP